MNKLDSFPLPLIIFLGILVFIAIAFLYFIVRAVINVLHEMNMEKQKKELLDEGLECFIVHGREIYAKNRKEAVRAFEIDQKKQNKKLRKQKKRSNRK